MGLILQSAAEPAGEFYAIDGPWVEPTTQDELNSLVRWIRVYHRSFNVIFDDPASQQATIDWRLLRDTILHSAQDWVDGQLQTRYAVPLRKTRNSGRNYDKNIVSLAALEVSQIIENRAFAGAAMPVQSEYGKQLLSDRDALLADIKSMRLRGQRLKANERTFDPNMEPVELPGKGSGADKANYQPKTTQQPM